MKQLLKIWLITAGFYTLFVVSTVVIQGQLPALWIHSVLLVVAFVIFFIKSESLSRAGKISRYQVISTSLIGSLLTIIVPWVAASILFMGYCTLGSFISGTPLCTT